MAQLRWAFIALAAKRRSLANPLGGASVHDEIRWSCQGRAASAISDTARRTSLSGNSRLGGSLMSHRSSHPIGGGSTARSENTT
jgi:hypothetical protein